MHDIIVKTKGLKKEFAPEGGTPTPVLRGIDLEIGATDFAIIYGPSGCGKSTLLHSLIGLETPSEGTVHIRDTDIYKLNPEERAIFRAQKFGMVFQAWYWIKSLSVWENVALPLLINGEKESVARKKAMEQLREVGMDKYATKRPSQLSGGEQQRVELARALINNPWIIVADEPTGNLDSKSSDEIIDLLKNLNKHHKRTIIMVTHNLAYLPLATRKIAMKDGLVIESEAEVKREIKAELKGVA